MIKDTFFESPKSWSRRKHRLLGKYLKPFSAKVGSWASVIYCIDGFAGAGKYADSSPGSPLLMAQLVDECARWQKPVNLRLINVEANSKNFTALSYLTAKWVTQGKVDNMPGEFGALVPDIISKIGNAAAFFFVDPYGPTQILFADLLPILKRSQGVTELIINFDADGLRRMADTIRSKAQKPAAIKGVKTTVKRVTEIVGSNGWESQFKTGKLSTPDRERVLRREYMNNLAHFGFTVVAYPIRKSIGDSPKYFLIFCTRHEDGIRLMNDFIREEEDELLRESTTVPGQLALLNAVEEEQKQRRDELKNLILGYIPQMQKTTRGQIKRHFKYRRFGDFHEKDYNAVVQELVDSGLLMTGHGHKRFNDAEPLTYTP